MGAPAERVNLRHPRLMEEVEALIEGHYRSELVDRLRAGSGRVEVGGLMVRLAKEFGFCYGVERAIDLAYAARRHFAGERIYILGEIIHNPEVNAQIRELGIRCLSGPMAEASIEEVEAGDVVIVPAFGAERGTMERLEARGCQIVDTTCGDVMKVWKRVRQNAEDDATSIIHGKVDHEETMATASRALRPDGRGHYLIVRNLEETDLVCAYIRGVGDRAAFLARFAGASSPGFDPDRHLDRVGVANQTTMMRGETEEVQRRVRQALEERYGAGQLERHFRFFDTICGATQDRQDALRGLLADGVDLLLVIGGYNSSNTTHLVELAETEIPTYFVSTAANLLSADRIRAFDIHRREEVELADWFPDSARVVGVTAGASCPNNLIEEVILRVFELRGVARQALVPA